MIFLNTFLFDHKEFGDETIVEPFPPNMRCDMKELLNEYIKVVWRDNNNWKTVKGYCYSVDDEFLKIKTRTLRQWIKKDTIERVSLQGVEDD